MKSVSEYFDMNPDKHWEIYNDLFDRQIDQCPTLLDELEYIKQKYTAKNEYIYAIYTLGCLVGFSVSLNLKIGWEAKSCFTM